MLDVTKTDPALGKEISKFLRKKGVETPLLTQNNSLTVEERIEKLKIHFEEILKILNLDLSDDSLCDTPTRLSKMYSRELFWGLDPANFPKITVVENKMRYREMVLERRIMVNSVCEHHFVPIDGYAYVGYIPDNKVAGLSKLNRVVEYFSRRPQVQERLTEQIFHSLRYLLDTEHVAVLIVAKHFCVKMRGAQDVNCDTITSRLGGAFYGEDSCRSEFMNLTRNNLI